MKDKRAILEAIRELDRRVQGIQTGVRELMRTALEEIEFQKKRADQAEQELAEYVEGGKEL